MPLKIISNSDVDKIVKAHQWDFTSGKNFVAATFYLLPKQNVGSLNYYSTKEAAQKQLYYLVGEPGYSKAQTPAGSISFTRNSSKGQTAGINVDLFLPALSMGSFPLPYSLHKDFFKIYPYYIVRFTKTDGSSTYYAILDVSVFGTAATVVNATGEKLKAMQDMYSNVAVIKGQYNALVGTINELIEKPSNPITQQTINRLTQRQISMLEQIKQIKGVSLVMNNSGTLNGIGFAPVAILVVIALVGVGGWALTTWISEAAKTKRIAAAYNHQAAMVEEQNKVMAACASGAYTKEQCNAALKNLGIAIKTGQDVADNQSQQQKGVFAEIGGAVKWIAVAFMVIKGMELIKTKN